MKAIEKLGFDHGRVLSIDTSEDKKTLVCMELCDCYFAVHLTKVESIELANHIIELANNLHDCEWKK